MKVKLLGPLEVDDDGDQPITVNGATQRALLVLLALDVGRAVPTDRLVEELWHDEAVGDAEAALQHQVSGLRKALGDGKVASAGRAYVLDLDPDGVDAVAFERLAADGRARLRVGHAGEAAAALREAGALWRGPPLTEFDHAWAHDAAAHLEQVQLGLVEDRMEAELRLGRHDDVVDELFALARGHPYQERLWAELMVALYRAGRRAEALTAYREIQGLLGEEKGLAVGPELRALEQAVLAHDPELRWRPEPAAGAGAAPVRPSSLPAPITPFVGRAASREAVRALVRGHRLVTLTGLGGVGKTRLAIEVARALADEQAAEVVDGVWFVALVSSTDPAAVPRAVAAVLAASAGLAVPLAEVGVGPDAIAATVIAFLRPRRALLVLDGCEHLLAEAAGWAAGALAAAPELRVLATSRQALGIAGEVQVPVPPLALPKAGRAALDELAASEAVQLFADRAGRVSGLTLTAATAPIVADACRRLDGLPLAIELAAARTKALSVRQIADGLDDRFRLLVANSTVPPERQRTLRGALDWSYGLLTDDERALLAALSVFEGGGAPDAVEAVAASMGLEPDRVLDLLVELVDQSLVVVTTRAAPAARYDLLETVRDYARTRLGERPDAIAARAAHRAWFLALADAADSGMISSEHRTWQRRLELEHGNLRAAYDDAIATGHADEAVRLVSRRWWFWSTTFRHAEGRALLEAALAVAGDDLDVALLVEALTVDCYLAGQLLDVDHAVAAGERAVALSLTLGDAWTTAWARQSLALSLEVRGDHGRASELLAAAREVMAAAGDDWRVAGNDLVTCVTGLVAGDLDHVETAAREVVVRSARAGFAPFRCWGQLVLAAVAERRGDLASALAEDQRALALARRLELPHYISFALTQLGRVARRSGDLRTAQVALDEAVAVADAAGASWFAALARRGLAQVHRARGDDAGAAALLEQVRAWADGPDSGSGAAVFFLVVGGEPVARSAPIQ